MDHKNAIIAVCTTALLLSSYAAGSLLDDDCHVATECECSGSKFVFGDHPNYYVGVSCRGKNLTRIPTFKTGSYKMSRAWTIDLHSNSIPYIPENAFSELQVYGNGNNVTVLLDYNNLYTENISDSAFSGIENRIIVLSLLKNHLTSIPTAIAKLTNLQVLILWQNPIKRLDPTCTIFISIHGTLKKLAVPVGNLPHWPASVQFFTQLEYLAVDTGYKSTGIPDDAFVGLDDTLRHLRTSGILRTEPANGKLIPDAVCNLGRLETLEIFQSNHKVLFGRDLLNCTQALNMTKYIIIQRARFDQFPNVFEPFPNVEELKFLNPGIRFMDDSLIPVDNHLKKFTCFSCKLSSIPGAINLFSYLQYCDLEHNEISTVERLSFDGLRHLHTIDLRDNPIIYVSRFAFGDLESLSIIDLGGTKITTIPQPVQTLPSLTALHLQRNNITCTCGEPGEQRWISPLSADIIFGLCRDSNETLSNFILNILPECP